MCQKDIFLKGEGDQYYKRNKDKLGKLGKECENDPIINILQSCRIKPNCILEIGCSDGWRLNALKKIYNDNVACFGIDPSEMAIIEGAQKFRKISLQHGTAESLPYDANTFDLIICGFCLYLCDRNDLFKIAYECDRVLSDAGILAIYDFHPSFPYRNEYKHDSKIYTYKMNYAKMFTWNPDYTIISKVLFSHSGDGVIDDPDERVSVILLKKNTLSAYPFNPFKKGNSTTC